MKNKLITTLFGLSLLVVPVVQATNNFDRMINLATLTTLATAVGGALMVGYKLYKNYSAVPELQKKTAVLEKENTELKEEVKELKERVTNLETTQTEMVAILKTIQGQSEGFMSRIANLWNTITGNNKAALKA